MGYAAEDPFASFPSSFDGEQHTFVKPRPGGARAFDLPAPAEPAAAEVADVAAPTLGLNPLVALANPLLLAVTQLRTTRHVADVAALRNALAQSLRDFATRAAAEGIPSDRVMAARYVLATVLDEAAADTPWGGSGTWGQASLLAMFHNETWGGEKVFQLMARLAERPDVNRDLLELIYAALSLGFEGRFRAAANGTAQLDAVRARLAQVLRQTRGDPPAVLADHWLGTPAAPRKAMLGGLPLAATAAVAALVLAGVYTALAVSLGSASDPVYASIQGLKLPPPMPVVVQAAPKPRLAQYLQPDIKAGLVAVRDEVDRSVVTVPGDGLFAPASAALLASRLELMGRIADAIAQVPGRVVVTGHTDAQPMHNARFPSNWHLSQARAETVRDLLAERRVGADRLRADGRADAEPVAPNDTPAGRAANRRVEIAVQVGRGAPADAGLPVPATAATASTKGRP